MMTDHQLAVIGDRVALFAAYGDPGALWPEDAADLYRELLAARRDRDHLVKLCRYQLDQLTVLRDLLAMNAVDRPGPW